MGDQYCSNSLCENFCGIDYDNGTTPYDEKIQNDRGGSISFCFARVCFLLGLIVLYGGIKASVRRVLRVFGARPQGERLFNMNNTENK